MGEVKHTPGPWTAETFVDNRPNGSEHHTYRITPQRGVYGSMFEADAKLAAAAPDLLEAIKALSASIFAPDDGRSPELSAALRMTVSAIAKAEGGAESLGKVRVPQEQSHAN
jgi:hypothetical protein